MSVREHAHEAKRDGYERHSYIHAFARKIYEKMKELGWKITENPQTNIHDLSRIDPQIMQKNAKDRVFVFPALCKIAVSLCNVGPRAHIFLNHLSSDLQSAPTYYAGLGNFVSPIRRE